jgi:hypothetical protein
MPNADNEAVMDALLAGIQTLAEQATKAGNHAVALQWAQAAHELGMTVEALGARANMQ